MALETLQDVSPGSPIKILATEWNALRRVAQRELKGQLAAPSATFPNFTSWPCLEVLVYNATGSTVNAGEILAIEGGLAEFPAYPREAAKNPVVSGATPVGTADAIGILLEPVATLNYGRAVIAGAAVCTINVVNANHDYAAPSPGSGAKLISVPAGPIRIIAKDSGTGDKAAIVALPSITPSRALVRCTSNTVTSGLQPGVVVQPDGDGTWTDSDAVKMLITEGDQFRNGGEYELQLNGFDSTTAIYSGIGSTSWEHTVCRDDVEETDRSWFYGYFENEENV
jgi:hypothetical protein